MPKRREDSERRAYWKAQMEAAFGMMEAVLVYPVAECGERLVSLEAAAQRTGAKIEFAAEKLAGRFERLFYIRESLADDVMRIAGDLTRRGWLLRIEDAYRTPEMQKELASSALVFDAILRSVIWENEGAIPSPELLLRRVSALAALRPKVGTHISGSALDISVLDARDGRAVDRGGAYPELSELAPMTSPYISGEARAHREAITAIFERHGFKAYPFEFWHYSKGDAYVGYLDKSGAPARYGPVTFDRKTGEVRPIARPAEWLVPLEKIQGLIERALRKEKTGRQE